MKALAVVVLLACWAVGTQGSPAVPRASSASARLVGITFGDFLSTLNIFKKPLPAPSTTHTAPITTRSASRPFMLGRREDERAVPIVFGDQGQRKTTTPSTTTSTSPKTEAAVSLPAKSGDDGAVVFPNRRRIGAPEDYECGILKNKISNQCVLELGQIMFNGTCERLLAKGRHCADGEWLVKVGAEEAECQPRHCPKGQVLYNQRCVNPSDVTVCAHGQMLYVSFDGKAECDCEPNFVYEPVSGGCYSQYERGPCMFGNYLDFTDTCSVECVHNDCVLNGYVKNSVTNECYHKMYDGFCDKNVQVFHRENHTVECAVIDLRNIFDVATLRSCPPGSRHDYLGQCREEFRVPAITSMPTLYSDCPRGFIKDPKGTCRRTHSLL